jgi:hypothetical protein
MANAFTKAQFMEPPSTSAVGPVPVGAVKAGSGIQIAADGTISTTQGGGTIQNIVCTNGIQGGGSTAQVFIGLLPPTETTIGGVYTVDGSGISIDTNGLIRSATNYVLTPGNGIFLTNVTPGGATVNLRIAGATANNLGGIYVNPALNPGLAVSPDGSLTLTPPQSTGIGGVKAGFGCTISALTGELNCTGTGGTITGVGAGTGLGGGGIAGAVTLFLRPANATTIGGIYPGANCTVDPDGKLNVDSGALGVLSVNAAPGSAIVVTGTSADPLVGVNVASTTGDGVVTIVDSTSSTQVAGFAASPNSVKTVADAAALKLPFTGGQMTGLIGFQAGQTFPGTVSSAAFTQTGGLLVGDSSPPGYAQLPVGADSYVLSANSSAPLGLEWVPSATSPTLQVVTTAGATTNVTTTFSSSAPGETGLKTVLSGRAVTFFDGTNDFITIENQPGGSQRVNFGPVAGTTGLSLYSPPGGESPNIRARSFTGNLTISGGSQLFFESTSGDPWGNFTSTGFTVDVPLTASGLTYPSADAASGYALTTNGAGTLGFSPVLLLGGGTMTGNITFNGTQTFPGVLANGSIGGAGAITIGGSPSNPIVSASTATTSALGVVQPDGTTITINGSGVISAAGAGASLPLAGGTMTGDIVFNAGQTFPGTVSSTLLDVTGDMVFASAANTPASLPIGAAGTILAVNGGLPAWRTSTQLGLLTSATAATTYAPIDSASLTGQVTITSGGSAGSNALTVSGGNLVLSTSFVPANSGATGTTGELAWGAGYLYFCYAPNTWGRVAIDLTPF